MENTDKSSKELHSEPLHKAGVIGSRFKPILFSAPMVQAILDGRKTQTRRIVKPQPTYLPITTTLENHESILKDYLNSGINKNIFKSQKIKIGDILWVRETSVFLHNQWIYKADNLSEMKLFSGWKPSIFMPKEACRIFLKVTDVRVERLQDISEKDAKAEGIERDKNGFMPTPDKFWAFDGSALFNSAKDAFAHLWKKINRENSWKENPWVWVYTFERIERPHDFR